MTLTHPYTLCFFQGETFVVGIAFWPGGTAAQWGPPGNDSRGLPGLNPCIGDVSINGSFINYGNYLTSKNVLFSTYGIGVDTMTALRNTKVEEDQLYDYVTAATGVEQVVSVIAFRGNIRSEAQYVRSNSAITGGTGVVKGLGLIVTMQGGIVTALEWYNFDGCASCGGTSSSECIHTDSDPSTQPHGQQSCATPLSDADCTCRGVTKCNSNCTTTYLVSFRGSSKSGQPLQSAGQLTSASQYSISATFTNFFNQVGNDLGSSINAGPIGNGVSAPGTTSPLPLPSGTQTDAVLSNAQNGIVPSPPPIVFETPSPSPVAVSPPTVDAATPTPAVDVASPSPVTDPNAANVVQPPPPAVVMSLASPDPNAG